MKTLSLNYLLVVLSWSLYLNHHFVSSIMLLLVACVYLLKERNRFNIVSIMVCFLVSFLALDGLYSITSINNYYLNFEYFALVLSMNFAMSNEIVKVLKKDNLYLTAKVILLLKLIFDTVLIVLPNEWYTMFTKTNIFVLIAFIFLPTVISVLIRILIKEFNHKFIVV